MFDIAHLKHRISQYAALWVGAFLIAGAAILIAMTMTDLMPAADLVLPVMLALVALTLGAGMIATFLSRQTLGTKLLVSILAVLFVLPLLWAPVAAGGGIPFFAGRALGYSGPHARLPLGVSEVLYPLSELFLGGAVFGAVWSAFQLFASIVGVISACARAWPFIRPALGPEPAAEA